MPKLTWQGKEQVLHHHLDVPFHLLDFFPNPDFYGFLKTSTPILIRVYF